MVEIKNKKSFFSVDGAVIVAPSVVLKRERPSRYGEIEGLPDEEMASPDELERMIYRQEFAPVLALPVKAGKSWIKPSIDEDGDIDWGAFSTVDFDRYTGGFDKARYKADRLEEESKDVIIRAKILNEHIKSNVKYKVLKYVRLGIIETDDIEDWDLWMLAKLYVRILRLQKQIAELREKSRIKKEKCLQKWFDLLGG